MWRLERRARQLHTAAALFLYNSASHTTATDSHVHFVTTDTQLRSRAPLVRGSGSGFNIQKQQVPVIHCLHVLSVVTRVDVIQQVVKLPSVSELCIIVCSNHGGCRDRSQGRPCPRPEGEFVYYLGTRNMADDIQTKSNHESCPLLRSGSRLSEVALSNAPSPRLAVCGK